MKTRHLTWILIACTLCVSCPPPTQNIAVTGVTLEPESVSLAVGESRALTVTILPNNATDQGVSWSSDDASVATVGAGNMLFAEGVGQTVVRVTTDDGGYTDTCAVEVTAAAVPVTGVTLEPESVSLEVGESRALTVTILPNNATDQGVSWSSDDASVATVGAGNMLFAEGVGQTVVRVTTDDGGYTDTCAVEVILHRFYVDIDQTTNPETGASWDEAFDHPNDVVGIAQPGDEVWVADGTYGLVEGNVVMTMVDGVRYYGGFQGIGIYESSLDDRRDTVIMDASFGPLTFFSDETILNGGGGALHVVVGADAVGDEQAILNGFTITGGNASTTPWRGGGMYNLDCSPVVEQCVFHDNTAVGNGAAISNNGGIPSVRRCLIEENNATNYDGGGIANIEAGASSDEPVEISEVLFIANTAGVEGSGNGGGIYNENSYVLVESCEFRGRSDDEFSAGFGGGISSFKNSASLSAGIVKIRDCSFSGNQARYGGGGIHFSETRNLADGDPGDPDPEDTSHIQSLVDNCRFANNSAQNGGGLYWSRAGEGRIDLRNSIFTDNEAWHISGAGGGAYVEGTPSLSPKEVNIYISGSSFTENTAIRGGGTYANTLRGLILMQDNILSDNTASQSNGGGATVVSSSGDGDISLIRNTFNGNSAPSGSGGGMYLITSDGEIFLENNVCYNNSAHAGGGFLISTANVLNMHNSTIFANIATGPVTVGGGILLQGGISEGIFHLVNNLFYNNLAQGGTIRNDIAKSPRPLILLHNGYHGIEGYEGNITAEENFDTLVSPGFADGYELAPESPAIDKGTQSNPYGGLQPFDYTDRPKIDRDNRPRIVDGDGDLVDVIDVGAYEF
jgi:predicted outer membrane repeat protein